MTIEIANRLCEFRKKFGYSQEQLANKLGVSRQSISNWESGEVTPSIDYLKELSSIYEVTLDELVSTDKTVDECTAKKEEQKTTENKEETNKDGSNGFSYNYKKDEDGTEHFSYDDGKNKTKGKDKVNISKDGIHVVSDDGDEVHISASGIFVNDESVNDMIHDGYMKATDDITKSKERHRKVESVSGIIYGIMSLIITVTYLLLGFLLPNGEGWYVYWTLFILIPVVSEMIKAIAYHKFTLVPVWCFVTFAFLFIGMKFGLWHPWWILFLLIPIYYSIFGPVDKAIRRHEMKKYGKKIVIDGEEVNIGSNKSAVKDSVSSIKAGEDRIRNNIDNVRKAINNLDGISVEDLNDTVDDLKDDIGDILDDIGDLKDDVESLNDDERLVPHELVQLRKEIGVLRDDAQRLRDELSNKKDSIKSKLDN
ncbi:MAG: helix-turn-helix domain-containing protein [Bacilli bacterium]